MFFRAVLAFLVLPGVVALAVPALISSGLPAHFGPLGLGLFASGVLILLWCVVAFYRSGKGTLAPWAPPRHLVTHGLYRFSRNPMYVGVLLMLAGWAVLYESAILGGYAAVIAIMFHVRVVFGEEPWLARTHGEKWRQYAQLVPRWLIRVRREPRSGAA